MPLEFGVTNPLDEALLHDAIREVRIVWKRQQRAPESTAPSILIYCRYKRGAHEQSPSWGVRRAKPPKAKMVTN